MKGKSVFWLLVLVIAGLVLVACQANPAVVNESVVEAQTGEQVAAADPTTAPVVENDSAGVEVAAADPDMSEQNMAIVRRFYEEFGAGNADVILELHPEILIMHYGGSVDEVPTQVLRDDLAAIKAANPDLHAEIHDMWAAGDYVFTELTWTATHTGDYFGIPATGQTVMHNGIVARRLAGGLIVESWEMWDDLVFLQSLGYLASWDELVANPPAAANPTADTPVSTPPDSPTGTYRAELSGNTSLEISPGFYQLTLVPDGTYNISWMPNEQAEHGGLVGAEGHYTVNGNQVTFTDEDGFAACSEADGVSGTYEWSFSGSALKLVRLEDNCSGRVYILTTKTFPPYSQ
jgi:steroid delta-isomerase-like uncharacterized protein